MGKIATKMLAFGDGWKVGDVVCSAGPSDRPYEEQHNSILIAVVIEGSFQYRSSGGSDVLSPGSLLLDTYQQCFECGHEHATGDRCVSFQYSPEFFERAGASAKFPVHRIPPIKSMASWVAAARLAAHAPGRVALEELAHGIAYAALDALDMQKQADPSPSAADERRISAILRFIENKLAEPLPLDQLAIMAKMSAFHFLRVFKQVTQVTPHQYILRARLREAALRPKTRSNSVLEIALDAGFQDLSNFNHAFRAEFGVTPANYARRA